MRIGPPAHQGDISIIAYRYQLQQNTLYSNSHNLQKQFLEASDWFARYNRGNLFN